MSAADLIKKVMKDDARIINMFGTLVGNVGKCGWRTGSHCSGAVEAVIRLVKEAPGLVFRSKIVLITYAALILIPMSTDAVYASPDKTLAAVSKGLALARNFGARVVSLTGLIPSATEYGRAVVQRGQNGYEHAVPHDSRLLVLHEMGGYHDELSSTWVLMALY